MEMMKRAFQRFGVRFRVTLGRCPRLELTCAFGAPDGNLRHEFADKKRPDSSARRWRAQSLAPSHFHFQMRKPWRLPQGATATYHDHPLPSRSPPAKRLIANRFLRLSGGGAGWRSALPDRPAACPRCPARGRWSAWCTRSPRRSGVRKPDRCNRKRFDRCPD